MFAIAAAHGIPVGVNQAGITNSVSQAYSMTSSMSREFAAQGQEMLVISAYNPTHGQNLDVIESMLIKNGGINIATVEATRLLIEDAAGHNAALARELRLSELAYTPVWGHSEGAAITTQALLTGVDSEVRKLVDLRVIGSPIGVAPAGLHTYVSAWNRNDQVAGLGRWATWTGGVENSRGFVEGNLASPGAYRAEPLDFKVIDLPPGVVRNDNHSLHYYLTQPSARSAFGLSPLNDELRRFYGHSYWRNGE